MCSLLVFVDDATGRLMELRFVEVESAFDYFASTSAYLQRHRDSALLNRRAQTGHFYFAGDRSFLLGFDIPPASRPPS